MSIPIYGWGTLSLYRGSFSDIINSPMETEKFLNRLEEDIKRLKTEYDRYFTGILKREPYPLKEKIEKAIVDYSRRRINNTALRFRFNALVARFNSYKTYWNKMLRRFEEGEETGKSKGKRGLS